MYKMHRARLNQVILRNKQHVLAVQTSRRLVFRTQSAIYS